MTSSHIVHLLFTQSSFRRKALMLEFDTRIAAGWKLLSLMKRWPLNKNIGWAVNIQMSLMIYVANELAALNKKKKREKLFWKKLWISSRMTETPPGREDAHVNLIFLTGFLWWFRILLFCFCFFPPTDSGWMAVVLVCDVASAADDRAALVNAPHCSPAAVWRPPLLI